MMITMMMNKKKNDDDDDDDDDDDEHEEIDFNDEDDDELTKVFIVLLQCINFLSIQKSALPSIFSIKESSILLPVFAINDDSSFRSLRARFLIL